METDQQGKIDWMEPWLRFCARYLDLSLYLICYAVLIRLFFPDGVSEIFVGILFFCVFCIGIEAICLYLWHTTMGKLLAGIVLQETEGAAISFWTAWKRTIWVWANGMAFGLPLVSLFAMWAARKKLLTNGCTDWDARYGTTVQYRAQPQWRRKVFIGISGILIVLVYIASHTGILGEYLDRTVPIPPGSLSSIINLCEEKRLDEALVEIDNYLKTHAPDEMAYNIKGKILMDQVKYEEAIPWFLKAVEKNPRFATGYNNLSWAYNNLHLYKLGVDYANKALALEPNDYHANANKGNALFGLKNYSEAIKFFDIALKADSKGYLAYWGKGLCYYRQEDYQKAIEFMRKYNEFCPPAEIADADYYITNSYMLLGDYQGAILEYKAQIARSAKAEQTSAYFGLGKAYQKLKDYTQAVSCYDHILGVDSQDAEAHYQKSKCLIALGQDGISLEHLALAIKNDDEYREIALEEPEFQVLSGDRRFIELVR